MSNSEKKNMICISCPIGCHLTGVKKDGEIIITGNSCNRGEVYGKEEMSSPKRVVTAVVKVKSKAHTYIPVRTNMPILKDKILDLLKKLYGLDVDLPIKMGDILIKDYNETGVDIIFSRDMK